MFRYLFGSERDKCHHSSAFNGLRKQALVLVASAGSPRRQNLSLTGQKITEYDRIFEIDVF